MLSAAAVEPTQTSERLTLSSKGWVVIPAAIRRKYSLHPGSMLTLVDYGGLLALVPLLPEPIEQTRGMLAGTTSLTQALLKERQLERQRE